MATRLVRTRTFKNPLGVGGTTLHEWAFPTRTFQRMFGADGGTTGVDDKFATRGFDNVGAWIMGRNMFGPVRGPWPDEAWKGWWGDNPPYHTPVFILSHYPRPSITMNGDTTFHFVTDGIHAALRRATEAANGRDVRLGGGAVTIREYLRAGLVKEWRPDAWIMAKQWLTTEGIIHELLESDVVVGHDKAIAERASVSR